MASAGGPVVLQLRGEGDSSRHQGDATPTDTIQLQQRPTPGLGSNLSVASYMPAPTERRSKLDPTSTALSAPGQNHSLCSEDKFTVIFCATARCLKHGNVTCLLLQLWISDMDSRQSIAALAERTFKNSAACSVGPPYPVSRAPSEKKKNPALYISHRES